MKKRIFISTSYDSLFFIDESKRNELGIPLLNDFNLLYWNKAITSFQSEHIDTDLLLLRDEIWIEEESKKQGIDALAGIEIRNGDHLMRHSRCTHSTDGFCDRVHSKGKHEPEDPFYTTVFNIIFDATIAAKDKAECIIEFLFGKVKFQQAYKQLWRSYTLACILKKNGSGITTHMTNARTQFATLAEHFESADRFLKTTEADSLNDIGDFLAKEANDIEHTLFDLPGVN